MHLRDARVDLAGQIVPAGRMGCTDDSLDAFLLRRHDSLTVSFRDGPETMVLTPSLADRDPASGFLIPTNAGPHIRIPAVIAAAILATLQSSSPVGARLQAAGQGGHLWSFDGVHRKGALFDWTLEVDVSDGSINVRLSAILDALDDSSARRERKDSRVDISFEVDAITRTALFEVPLPTLDEGRNLSYPPRAESLPEGLRLDFASIDQGGALHAYSRSGFVRLTTGYANGFIVDPSYSTRLPEGFLNHPRYSAYFPQVRLNGINLPSLIAALGGGSAFVSHAEGSLGSVENDLRNEIPTQDVQKSSITARIDAGGLIVEYRLLLTVPERGLPGVIEDRLTIPWASLILRYPHRRLLAQRQHLKTAKPQHLETEKPKSWRSMLWPRSV